MVHSNGMTTLMMTTNRQGRFIANVQFQRAAAEMVAALCLSSAQGINTVRRRREGGT